MNWLLDTHYMLWAVTSPRKLSRKIKDILTDPNERIIVSAISFWEVSLKISLGKLGINGFSADDLPEACLQIGFKIIELSWEDSSTYHQLKAKHHKDPFDRLLIWQAIRNDYILISADDHVKKYASEGLKIAS